MTKIDAIIFDCFGVLYVSVSEVYFAAFPDKASQLHDLSAACDRGFISQAEYMNSVAKVTGDSVMAVEQAMLGEYTVNRPLITYVQHSLKPHYKIGLLSNIGRGWIQHFFDEHELHDLFDASVLSSEEGIVKPEPDIYRRMAARLEVAPANCLMIDDRVDNCQGAEVAGMQSLLYTTFGQLKNELDKHLHKH